MKKNEKGFTLIEIMVVVTIIAILAAYAVPAYTDYAIRARLTELIDLGNSQKTVLVEDYLSTYTCPDNDSKAAGGFRAADDYAGGYVGRLRVNSSGHVIKFENGSTAQSVCLMSITVRGGSKVPAAIRDKGIRFRMALQNSAIVWQCSVDRNGIDFKYLPPECRNY